MTVDAKWKHNLIYQFVVTSQSKQYFFVFMVNKETYQTTMLWSRKFCQVGRVGVLTLFFIHQWYFTDDHTDLHREAKGQIS